MLSNTQTNAPPGGTVVTATIIKGNLQLFIFSKCSEADVVVNGCLEKEKNTFIFYSNLIAIQCKYLDIPTCIHSCVHLSLLSVQNSVSVSQCSVSAVAVLARLEASGGKASADGAQWWPQNGPILTSLNTLHNMKRSNSSYFM